MLFSNDNALQSEHLDPPNALAVFSLLYNLNGAEIFPKGTTVVFFFHTNGKRSRIVLFHLTENSHRFFHTNGSALNLDFLQSLTKRQPLFGFLPVPME